MDGVVSLLDAGHAELVEGLWSELRRELGICGVCAVRVPHISYHVAQGYDVPALKPVLQHFSVAWPSFAIRTAGLALFSGPRPVLHIPVVRNAELSRFQEALWHAVSPAATDTHEVYNPDRWLPHITLAYGDLKVEDVPKVFTLLAERDFDWEIRIDNVALICEDDSGRQPAEIYPLQGQE